MCNSAFEYGAVEARFIDMGIKMVSTDIGEVDDVSLCNGVFGSGDGVPDDKVFEVLLKQVRLGFNLLATRLVFLSYGCQCRWGSLDGCSLHIVVNATDASHFLTASGSSGPAVSEQREGRTMPG